MCDLGTMDQNVLLKLSLWLALYLGKAKASSLSKALGSIESYQLLPKLLNACVFLVCYT